MPAWPEPGHGHGRTCVPEAGCPAHACCSLIPALLPTRLTWAASGFGSGVEDPGERLSWKSQKEKTAQLGQGGSLGAVGRFPTPGSDGPAPQYTGQASPTRQALSSPGSSHSKGQALTAPGAHNREPSDKSSHFLSTYYAYDLAPIFLTTLRTVLSHAPSDTETKAQNQTRGSQLPHVSGPVQARGAHRTTSFLH